MNSLADAYIELQPKLYTFFLLKTSNIAVSEDLTQDVFYEASKTIHTFKGDAQISTWLFAIARNLLSKYYRSKKYEMALNEKIRDASAVLTPYQLIEKAVIEKEQLTDIQKAICTLEPLTQEIVLLRLYGELSFAEIGQLLEKSENYTRVTFFRAKQKVQKKLEGYE